MDNFYEECAGSIIDLDGERAEELAKKAIDEGRPVIGTIEKGFVKGIREVGRLWEEGSIFLPELVIGAEAMKRAMAVLQPHIDAGETEPSDMRTVVIGTIQGDIHDIGKTLVATMLSANGFEVHDLGADVPIERFVEEAAKSNADFIAISALLTTTMPGQKKVVEEIEKRSMKDKVKIVVGGAPCSSEWAEEIGADGYAGDAVSAVNLVQRLAEAS